MVCRSARVASLGLSLGLLCCVSSRGFGQQTPALISTGTSSGLRLFAPNSNDWWFDPLAGRLDIKVNGGAVPLATLNSLGSLGIGTTSPSARLHVVGDIGAFSAAGRKISLSHDGSEGIIQVPGISPGGSLSLKVDSTGSIIRFFVGGGEAIRIDGLQRVGIGTSSMINRLEVWGKAAFGTYGDGFTPAPANGVIVSGSVGVGTSSPSQKFQVAGGGVRVDTGTAVGSPAFFINPSNGLVGLGTASPQAYLHVTGQNTAVLIDATDPASSTANLDFKVLGAAQGSVFGYASGLYLNSPSRVTTRVANLDRVLADASGLTINSNAASAGFALQVASQNATGMLTVLGNGSVGIGTTNPTSALNVFNGNIKITTNTGTSYGIVFQDGTTQTTAASASSAQSASTFTVLSAASYAGNTCPACTAACIAGSTITLVTANTSVTVSLVSSGMQNTNSAGVSAGFLVDGVKPDNNLNNWMAVGAYSNAVIPANFSYTTINKLSAGPHSFCLVVNGIGSLANSTLLCSSFISAAGCLFQVREYR